LVYLPDAGGAIERPVYDGGAHRGIVIEVPALIEEETTAILSSPKATVNTDSPGNPFISL
jgi:hypothetical protein